MKILILAIALVASAILILKLFAVDTPPYPEPQVTTFNAPLSAPKRVLETPTSFQCDGRQYCSQMRSRAEAEYFLANCPEVKMDGDHDGIPCENDSRF